jgi:hypothetical protein
MARRRTARKKSRPQRHWRRLPTNMPRLTLNLRWLTRPFAAMFSRFDRQAWQRAKIGASWALALAALVAAWTLGVSRLQAFASHQRFASHVDIQFSETPAWLTPEIHERLIRTAQSCITGDPLRTHELIECRDALAATGWFEHVRQVRRVRAGLVEIDADFARPYAVIRDDSGDHLVDVIGRLLPWGWPRGESAKHTKLTAITGVYFARPQRPGTPWEGTDVIAGLRLLNLIDQQEWKLQVTEVDVSGYVKGEPIRLRTDRQTAIVWGAAPGEEQALEVLANNKLKRLNDLFKTYGRIDAGELIGELDITSEKAVVTR